MVRHQNTEKSIYSKLLLVLIIIAVIAFVYVMLPRSGNSKTKTVPAASNELVINVIPLKTQDVTVSSKYIGYVTPIKAVDLVPKVSGYLEEIWVEGGQEVKAGDNLILIQQKEYKAQLDAAKASVTQALANFNNAQVYYQRIQKAGAKAISKTEVDNAKAKFLAAKGALAQAQADREEAQVHYDDTLLQASISGIVGNVDLTRGNYVSPASPPLLKIIQYDPIRVVFSITDKEYLYELMRHPDNLFEGEKIKLQLADGLVYPLDGQFKYTANEINRSTNSIAIYADFDNPSRSLVANAYVDVVLERNIKDAYLVRQNYVTMDEDGSYIYTVQGNKLLKTPIDIVTTVNNDYLVRNRFAQNEYLVVDKLGTIPKDAKIKINVQTASSNQKEKK